MRLTCFVQVQQTPLYLASTNGHESLVAMLLSEGVNIEAADKVHKYSYVKQCAMHELYSASGYTRY